MLDLETYVLRFFSRWIVPYPLWVRDG